MNIPKFTRYNSPVIRGPVQDGALLSALERALNLNFAAPFQVTDSPAGRVVSLPRGLTNVTCQILSVIATGRYTAASISGTVNNKPSGALKVSDLGFLYTVPGSGSSSGSGQVADVEFWNISEAVIDEGSYSGSSSYAPDDTGPLQAGDIVSGVFLTQNANTGLKIVGGGPSGGTGGIFPVVLDRVGGTDGGYTVGGGPTATSCRWIYNVYDVSDFPVSGYKQIGWNMLPIFLMAVPSSATPVAGGGLSEGAYGLATYVSTNSYFYGLSNTSSGSGSGGSNGGLILLYANEVANVGSCTTQPGSGSGS